ncbi:GNAT family N-acetyltransferase [Flagellimonas meridianipacifica]|uniref:Acetyltransferase (GNAT) family protein n=1 Tax=Flagellimonas meridianipacifica TaxID=1080225 RepID=A0A2T0MCS6_9FLAO|nr:GNAT family N-acetyltransferase [Allomuricauda pacifica]PRX55280.1 acetyltransferase (GNAT) family protein [Allomuricauda pacifica]
MKDTMAHNIHLGFLLMLFRKREVPSAYQELRYLEEKPIEFNQDFKLVSYLKRDVGSYRLVPEYLNLKLHPDFGSKIIPQHNWGYSLNLSNCNTVDDYLEQQFKSKYRSIVRRYVKRLEACFDIRYAFHYGTLERDVYESIMDSLQKMIEKRFQQRNEVHKENVYWQSIKEESLRLIHNQEASLFVIYANEEPIEISLNYHFDKILFSSVSSYDIDYAKFGLGHIEIYKQLEWCLQNGYKIFEMGVGGMDYKRRWSNQIYQFQHHIVFPAEKKNSVLTLFEWYKIKLKEYLKSKGINDKLEILKLKITKRLSKENNTSPLELEVGPISPVESIQDYIEVDWQNDTYWFLRKPINDFLYTSVEHYSQIGVMQSKTDGNSYLFLGRKQMQQVSFYNMAK